MSKLPAFQFYPADWRKDPGVQALGFFERGVWFEILCLMHESEQRGKLLLNGRPMPNEALARLLGLDKQLLTKTLTTLLEYGVASQDEQGALISRRMVKDEELRKIRTEAGKKGGNPNLVNQNSTKTEKEVNQKSTPSSSSSTSNTKEEKEKTNVSSKKKIGSRIPSDFRPSPEMIAWALNMIPTIDLERRILEFKNYWETKTGKDATKLDWNKTFQNRILQIVEWKGKQEKEKNGSSNTYQTNKRTDGGGGYNGESAEDTLAAIRRSIDATRTEFQM